MLWQIKFSLVLAGIGILNTLYLSYHSITKTKVYCLFFPPEWCEKVQFSSYSKTFGIPNGFLGFIMYLALFILLILVAQGISPMWPVLWLVGFGWAFSMYFLYIQAFVLKAFCTWCVLSALEFSLLAAINFIF